MIKLIVISGCVLLAFAFMLGAIFLGDYKKMRTRIRREKWGITRMDEKEDGISCAGCDGNCLR